MNFFLNNLRVLKKLLLKILTSQRKTHVIFGISDIKIPENRAKILILKSTFFRSIYSFCPISYIFSKLHCLCAPAKYSPIFLKLRDLLVFGEYKNTKIPHPYLLGSTEF